MIDPESRYYALEDRTREVDGRLVVYKARRFLPRRSSAPPMGTVRVLPGDRPDRAAARLVQQPELYWRLCDAAVVLHPRELVEQPGRRLSVQMPVPGA